MKNEYNPGSSIRPRQKLPRSEKTEDWGRANVDFIMRSSIGSNSDSDINFFARMQINYDLYNNIINRSDFTYVTNPYGLKNEFPARLNNFNIITPKLKVLEGEEIKRPFNFRVAAVNADAVSQIEEKRKTLLLQYLESELVTELQAQGIEVTNPETGEVMTPEQIDKYMSYTDADIRESIANKIANYIIKEQNLEYKFNRGWRDALISAMELYYVGIDGNTPICEPINPLDFDYDKSPDQDFIEDGQWAKHTKYCTPSEIIDRYYDFLTDEQIRAIDTGDYTGATNASGQGLINISYSQNAFSSHNRIGHIPVTRVEWKSLRKIGFLKYYDENMEEQEVIVDETYKAQKEKGETIEWNWINEVWEGTKIGNHIYVNIRPKTVQYRTMDNPAICKLGYVGTIYNNRNSIPTSLVDLVKHHQYLYNIIMYRMEFEIAKAKGKKMVMDVAQIPRSQGIDLEKWMYYFDSLGIAFINSFEEGKGKFQGQTSAFNQFTAVDMSLSQAVGQYINILNMIEEQAASLMGVSRQREGSIQSSETVGGVERSVAQSSHITEPLFYIHGEVKKHVLTQLIECAKVAYPSGHKINYILDDMSRVFLTVDEEFQNADYGVFVTNSAKEVKALDDLKAIAQQAVASGIITLTELVSIFDSTSIADVKNVVKKAEQKADQQRQAEQDQEQGLQQQMIDGQKELEEYKADRLDDREVIKGEIQKELAYIKTFGGVNASPTDDADSDGVPDVVEFMNFYQERDQHKEKMQLEREKIKSNEKIAEAKNKVDMVKARQKPKTSK